MINLYIVYELKNNRVDGPDFTIYCPDWIVWICKNN